MHQPIAQAALALRPAAVSGRATAVLLVEEDAAIAAVTAAILTAAGYQMDQAGRPGRAPCPAGRPHAARAARAVGVVSDRDARSPGPPPRHPPTAGGVALPLLVADAAPPRLA